MPAAHCKCGKATPYLDGMVGVLSCPHCGEELADFGAGKTANTAITQPPPVGRAPDLGYRAFAAGPPRAALSEIAAGLPPPLPSSQGPSSQPDDALAGMQLFGFVNAQLERGYDNNQVQKQLVDQGHDPLFALSMVSAVASARRNIVREAGLRNMFIGGGVSLVGLIGTVISYKLAVAYGWSTFTIATGAIVFGALQFLYGLLQAIFGSK